tara:strand:+ start:1031 stop:3457 length:2427 start_codon:yes stop_codon:yes gene_type:complete
MVYTNHVDASRTHFILFSSNYNDDLSFIGTKINIKTYIPREIATDSNYYQFGNKVFNENDFGSELFKNRVIFSTKINDDSKRSITLLTQQNLFHNIKFIQKDNDFNKPRILFIKYNITNNISNNNQYLFNSVDNKTDLSNINLTDISLNINNTDNEILGINDSTYLNLSKLSYFFNIYKPFVNSDYFKFKFSDFIDLSFTLQNNTNISEYNKNLLKINAKNINLKNNFATNNLINYDENNFTNLFNFDHLGPIHTNLSALDVSTVFPFKFNENNEYKFDNILLYNKIDNISSIKYNLNYPNFSSNSDIIDSYSDICINFIILKGYDYFSKEYGKIYLTSDFTFINSRVLDYNNNFYSTNVINRSGLDSSMVYLSLGNAITGITQKNLYTNIKLDIQSEEITTKNQKSKKYGAINKIYFTSSVNSINVDNKIKNRNYLLDENYNYNYTNILYNNIQESNKKNLNYNLLDFYHNYNSDFSQNIYNHRFNSLGLLNNEISSNKFDISYVNTNNDFFITNRSDISFLDLEYKFRFNNISINSNNANTVLLNQPISNNSLNYDFRFNYDTIFNLDIYYTLNYNYGSDINDLSFEKLNDYSSKLLLNFHKIISTSNFVTPTGSDFTNVDCIFIYYNPYDDNTPEQFRYPYNNIEISNNPSIDTLSRSIELLPGANTSVTNTTFIPARNGSNLSRKRIQGLIGLNDIPGLLSIEPYDENFITGRGFLNQYQIEDECKTDIDKVENKLNSQKHISVKNPIVNNLNTNKISKSKNFANIVRNRKQNQNISRTETCKTDPSTIQNYTTPFTNPLWKKR